MGDSTPPTDTVIQGNWIGTDQSGTLAIPNGDRGVRLTDAQGMVIGGTLAGEGNTIAFNTNNGVSIEGSLGTTVSGNHIYANGELGIDLDDDGVTANDTGDGDSGPNNLQNYPVLTAATSDGVSSSTVEGNLNSTASTTFRDELQLALRV